MDISNAISNARALLHLKPVETGSDPRWQAILAVGEFIECSPVEIWQFINCARVDADEDLEAALITILLEHLIEPHEAYKRQAQKVAESDEQMKAMLAGCW